ncbi:MAG: ATP-binding protein, partial [Bacteroidota bacterium]
MLNTKSGELEHFQHIAGDPNSLANNNVYSILKDGPYLWLGLYAGGIDRLDLRDMSIRHIQSDPSGSNGLTSNDVRVLFQDLEGDIWVGTEKGLHLMQGREPDQLQFKRFLPETEIYAIQATEAAGIWIGTYNHGLYYLNKSDWSVLQYTTKDGLPGNSVFGILESKGRHLWLSTNQGITRFTPSRKLFSSYSYANGLEALEFSFNAYAKTSAGELLFGSTNGFTLFRPEDINFNTFVPPVVFTGLTVRNQQIEVQPNKLLSRSLNHTQRLTFAHNEANFTLDFAALDYSNPQGNQYAYRMEGIDQDWQYRIGQQSATYTIQRDGRYIFHLKGANNEGIWNPVERQLEIVVLPPPWRTWWAYMLYALAAVLIVLVIIRFVKLQHSYQLEKLGTQKQEELHQTKLRFFTNITHEFRTPLTLILGPLQDLLSSDELNAKARKHLIAIERNGQRLLNLVNQLLDFRKLEAEHGRVEAAQGNFVRFLREIYLSFQGLAQRQDIQYQFESEADEYLLWYDRDKMEKVFYNLLSNAFKFTPQGGRISVRLSARSEGLQIEVIDTGRGVPRDLQAHIFDRYYEHSSEAGLGIGLAYTRQLLELHNGSIQLESDGKQGSNFVVFLPFGKAHFRSQDLLEDFRNSEDSSHYTLTQSEARTTKSDQEGTTQSRLLIVEDNQEVRSYIGQIFKGEYELTFANNGQEGLQMAQEQLPDLIISDVMMPIMDGIEICLDFGTKGNTIHYRHHH